MSEFGIGEYITTERSLGRRIVDFKGEQSGTIAVVFAFALVVICIFVGGAIDFGRWYNARQHTIQAMDAAVLAGGRTLQLQNDNADAAIAVAQAFYAEGTKKRLKTTDETITFKPADNNTAFVSEGNAYIKTTFLRLANINRLPLLATNGSEFARAELGGPGKSKINLEISLILDTTGSMQGQKLADLKVAAQSFIDMIVVAAPGGKPSRVAIVPYSSSVNVDSYASQVRGSDSPGTCTYVGCKNYTFPNVFGQPVTLKVSNCATERTGANAYTDVAPSEELFGWSYMPTSNPCPANSILPMTSDANLLKSTIGSLQAYGALAELRLSVARE
jgi:Flp pilus assembly protein TadG